MASKTEKTTVTLELTDFEAQVLSRLTMDGVEWATSGKFGDAVRAINLALYFEGFGEADYKPSYHKVVRDRLLQSRTWVSSIEAST